jgi:hypothetical protein
VKGYSESEVFLPHEVRLWQAVTKLVEGLPEDPKFQVRCHELARAVAIYCLKNSIYPRGLVVVDGKFGGVEHSWVEATRFTWERRKRIILDVYAVGTLPMVQLIDFEGSIGLYSARRYIEGTKRTDIDRQMIERLMDAFKQTVSS